MISDRMYETDSACVGAVTCTVSFLKRYVCVMLICKRRASTERLMSVHHYAERLSVLKMATSRQKSHCLSF